MSKDKKMSVRQWALVERDQQGKKTFIDLTDAPLKWVAKQGHSYALIDKGTQQAVPKVTLKRKGDVLQILGDDEEILVDLEKYYSEEGVAWSQNGSFTGVDISRALPIEGVVATEAVAAPAALSALQWGLGGVVAGVLLGQSGSGSSTPTPTPPSSPQNTNQPFDLNAVLHDDYIAYAQVFADLNGNGKWDQGEPLTQTDAKGNFKLEGIVAKDVNLIAVGGIDIASGVPNNIVYRFNLSGVKDVQGHDLVISPISTLITAIAEALAADAGTAITAAILKSAAEMFSQALNLGLDDASLLLNIDAVKAAYSPGADQATGLDILSLSRQISVVVAAAGALINGADENSTNVGTVVAARAIANLLISGEPQLDFTSALDVEKMLQAAMDLSNSSEVTTDLKASTPDDLKQISQILSDFNQRIDQATEQETDVISADSLAAMVAVNDLMVPLLQNSGSEAASEREGDISLATILMQFKDAVAEENNIADYVDSKITAQKSSVIYAFGSIQSVAGYVDDYVPLGIQLPAMEGGKIVDKVFLDLAELAAQTAQSSGGSANVEIFRFDPLTQQYIELAYSTNNPSLEVSPQHVGYLYVKTDAPLVAAKVNGVDVFKAAIEIPVRATFTEGGQTARFSGELTVEIRNRPLDIKPKVTSVIAESEVIPHNTYTNNNDDPLIRGVLNQNLPAGDEGRYYAIEIYEDSRYLGLAVVDVNDRKKWSFDPGDTLSEGAHTYTARITFRQPNGALITLNSGSLAYTVIVDTLAPNAPAFVVDADRVFLGTAEPGTTVTLVRKAPANSLQQDEVVATVLVDQNGRWTYIPDAQDDIVDGDKFFAYTTDAATNRSPNSSQLTVIPGGSNSEPVIGEADDEVVVEGDAPITGQLTAFDVDGDDLVFSLKTPIDGLTLDADGSWTFDTRTANLDFLGEGEEYPIVVTYVVTDEWGDEDSSSFTIMVKGTTPSILSVEPSSLRAVAAPAAGDTVTLAFTVSRDGSRDLEEDNVVGWTLTGLSAKDFEGGVLPFGTVKFEQGANTATILVEVPASLSGEVLRQAVLKLETPGAGYVVDAANEEATMTLIDSSLADDGVVVLTVSADQPVKLQEGAESDLNQITYTVSRSGDVSTELQIAYRLDSVGAALISGQDFADANGEALVDLPSGNLVFAAGDREAKITVTVRGDDAVGPLESFNLVLTELPSGARVQGQTYGEISNDDVYISVAPDSIKGTGQGDVTHQFVVTRSGATEGTHTVYYTLQGVGEQASSLVLTDEPVELVFAEGETEKTIQFTSFADKAIAGFQSFSIELQAAPGDNITLVNTKAVAGIVPNLQDVELRADIDRIAEGSSSSFSYTVTRSGATDKALSLKWSVQGDGENAAAAADFEGSLLPKGVITFAADEATATITFKTGQDALLEGDEGFVLVLDPIDLPPGVRLLTPQQEGFVVDDESAVGFGPESAFAVVEGDDGSSNLMVEVTRIGFTGNESTVEWRVSAGTANLSDFAAGQDALGNNGGFPSGVLTLQPGEALGSVAIRIAGDTAFEGGLDETLSVTLSNPSEGTKLIGGSGPTGVSFAGYGKTTTATIQNDDSQVQFESNRVSVTEDNGGTSDFIEITVTRTGSRVGEDTVKWSLTTADSGPSADNADIGQDNSAVGVFDQYQNSWIDIAHLKGSQTASGSVQITKSGYIMVAYNRDMEFDDYDDGNPVFDQFLLKNLSLSGGGTLTALAPVTDQDFFASGAAVTGYGQVLFNNLQSLALPGDEDEGRQIVISSKDNLAGIYFKVSGLDADGDAITEIIKGSNQGASSTAAYFTEVFKVETLAPGFAVGELDIPTDDYDSYEYEYFTKLKISWDSGELQSVKDAVANDYGSWTALRGAEYEGDMGFPVLQSEADLSDAVFVIKGGLAVAHFDSTHHEYVNFDFKEGDGDYGQDEFLKFDVAQHIRAEQVSGIFQGEDGSDEAQIFMVTGLNQAGEKITEIMEVEDFEVNGLAEVNQYTDGNLIVGNIDFDHAGRIMISTNGENIQLRTAIWTEEEFLNNYNLQSIEDVDYIQIQNIGSGLIERFDGQQWQTIESNNNIDRQDIANGHIRISAGMSGSMMDIEVRDNINGNYNWQKINLVEPLKFTVTGLNAQGQVITETIAAPDFEYLVNENGREGDKATVATVKTFASVSSIVADQAFDGNIQIGVSKPVETVNKFTAVYGIAPIDAEGEYLDPEGEAFASSFAGRVEFKVPLEVTVQGPNASVVVSPQVMNYIESIEVQRSLPEDMRVDIGFQEKSGPLVLSLEDLVSLTQTNYSLDGLDRVRIYRGGGDPVIEYNDGTDEDPYWVEILEGDNESLRRENDWPVEKMFRLQDPSTPVYQIRLYDEISNDDTRYYEVAAPSPSSNFIILQNPDGSLTAEVNNNFEFNTDIRWETGNIFPEDQPNMGYAIFRVDAPNATVDAPVTLNFDLAQLGRYGFDVGRIAYAPDGTFSTTVRDMISDGQNALITPLVAQEKMNVLTLSDFSKGLGDSGPLDIDPSTITEVYIDDVGSQADWYFLTENGWREFWSYTDDAENGSTISAQDIADGKLAYVGTWGRVDYDVTHGGGEDSAYFVRVDQKLDLEAFANASVSTDLMEQIEINNYDNTDLVFNINPEGEAVWMDLSDYFDQQASSVISKQDILDGRIGVLAGLDQDFTVDGVVHHSGGQDQFTLTGTGASFEPMVVASTGVVDLPGDGYIWVRYANMFDGNEGADMAWINSLYVDNGATLTVVGRKALSDGIANSQQIAGDTELDLNGVSVTYSMPDHSAIDGDLMMYISSPDIEKFDGLDYQYIGKNASGQTVNNNEYFSSFYGTEKPNDGMVRFLSMDDMGVSNLERLNWEEETSSPQLWEPNFGVVKGSLNHLADGVLLANMGEDWFDISYYPQEFRPGAPVRVEDGDYDDSNNTYLPTEELLPTFSRSILMAQSFTEEAQDIDVNEEFQGAQRVTLTSTQDMSGRAITITGTDAQGDPLVEVINNGPDACTVGTVGQFATVTGISIAAGPGSGHLSVGQAWVFATGTMLGAYSYDGMPDTTITMVGLGLDGQFLSVELNGTETGVTHPLGMFTEVWSLINDGKASENLRIVEINKPQNVFVLGQYNDTAFHQITDTTVDTAYSDFQEWVYPGNYSADAPAQLVFQVSPELIGRTVEFYGYAPTIGNDQWFQMTIPESGVLVTPQGFDWANNFSIKEGDGSGQMTLSWLKPLPPNSDHALNTSSDFLGELVLTGVDANGKVITRTVNSLEAGTAEALSDMTGLIGYSYLGAGDAPVITLTSTSKYSFFQPITLVGERDSNGFIALGGEKNVVITVDRSDAENQIIQVTGLVDGELVTETLYGIADSGLAVITKNLFTHVQKIEVGADNNNKTQSFSVGTVVSIIDEQKVSRYGGDMKLGEAVAVLESASKVTLTSTDNLSASEFTITGLDAAGRQITETIVGPNASTAMSTKVFTQVTSIVASGDASGQIKVGYVTQAGAMVDDFVITGSGTKANPLAGHSTNTLEAYLSQGEDVGAIYSEADVLLYVDTKNAQGPVKLHYDLAVQGSAAMGEDVPADCLYVEYSASKTALMTGEVTFADGEPQATIRIPVAGDDTREADESMRLTLTTASPGVTIVNDQRTSDITIVNDDDQVTLSATAKSTTEGNSSETDNVLRFTITRLDTGTAKEVRWHLEGLSSEEGADENAADEEDFEATSGVVTFAANALTATIQVAIQGDRVYEGTETFRLVLSEPEAGSGYSLGANASALGTVTEDDVGIRITADQVSKNETDGQVSHTFTVTRVGDLSQSSALRWSVSGTDSTDDIDVSAADFGGTIPTNQVLNFAAGESSQIITVNTVGDNEMTGDSAFTVTLTNVSGDTSDLLEGAKAQGLIVEDDAVNLSIGSDVRQEEGSLPLPDKELTYTLTRADATQAASYNWQLLLEGDGENLSASAADFAYGQDSLPSGTAVFAVGQLTQTIKVKVANDDLIESDEAFKLEFEGVNATVAAAQKITAYLVNDTDAYSLQVKVAGEVIASGSPGFEEGQGGMTEVEVTFLRAGNSSSEVTLTYSLQGGVTNPMIASDFKNAQGTVLTSLPTDQDITFDALQTSVTRKFFVSADFLQEEDESFKIVLKNGSVEVASQTIQVLNDDAGLVLGVDRSELEEGSHMAEAIDEDIYSTLTYTVSRSGELDQVSTVSWSVKAQNGITAGDFFGYDGDLPSGTLTFEAGDPESKTFTIQVLQDWQYEGAFENLVVELSNASVGTQIITGTATTKILDDDKEVGFSAETIAQTVTEGSPTEVTMVNGTDFVDLTYTIVRTGNDREGQQSVTWTLSGDSRNGDAATVDSYEGPYLGWSNADVIGVMGEIDEDTGNFTRATSDTLVFENNDDNEKTITIRVHKDHYQENPEAFKITLSDTSAGLSVSATHGVATGQITDDDIALVLDPTSATRVTKAEGQPDGSSNVYTEYSWVINRKGANEAVDLAWRVETHSVNDLGLWVDAGGEVRDWWTQSVSADSSDFSADSLTGTLSFASDDASQTLTIRVLGDEVVESTETFKVYFTKPDNVGDISGLGNWYEGPTSSYVEGVVLRDEGRIGIVSYELDIDTIADYDPEEQETLDAASAKAEGDEGFVSHFFKIYRDFTTEGDASIDWRVDDGPISVKTDASPFLNHAINKSALVDDFMPEQNGLSQVNGFPSGRVTIPDGEAFVIIEIKTKADRTAEDLESFWVRLSNPSEGSTLSQYNPTSVGYLANDDHPLFSVGQIVPEGDNTLTSASYGSKVVTEGDTVTYRVYRSGSTDHIALVNWAVVSPDPVTGASTSDTNSASNYTAHASDFTTQDLSGTLTFNAGESSKVIILQISADSSQESWAEAFSIALSSPRWDASVPEQVRNAYTPAISAVAGTMESIIVDADAPMATVAVSAVTRSGDSTETPLFEGADRTITYTLTKSGTGAGQIAWKLALPTHSYVSGGDITQGINGDTSAQWVQDGGRSYATGLVAFGEDETVKTVVVHLRNDGYVEDDENFVFTLIDGKTVLENGFDFGNAYEKLTSPWDTYGDGTDAANKHGIHFLDAAGSIPDSGSLYRDPEAYQVTSLVKNDDGIIVVNNVNVQQWNVGANVFEGDEGDTVFTASITRAGRLDHEVTVNYVVLDSTDTVIAGSEGTWTLSEDATVTDGNGSKTYTLDFVLGQGDTTVGANQSFKIRLTGVSDPSVQFNQYTHENGGLATRDIPVTVVNDDTIWSMSSTTTTQTESDDAREYSFNITRPSTQGYYQGPATVTYKIMADDASGAHTVDNDDIVNGLGERTVSFISGETTKLVEFQVKGDRLAERNETFQVKLVSASQGEIHLVDKAVTYTIVNDDTTVEISAALPQAEGDSSNANYLEFNVVRKGQIESQSSTVKWAVHNGTATWLNDLSPESVSTDTLTFDAGLSDVTVSQDSGYGEQTQVVRVYIQGDATPEPHEKIKLSLSDATDSDGIASGKGSADGEILNDDASFSVIAGDVVKEGDAEGQMFTITRMHLTAQEQTIHWSFNGVGTHAADSADFDGSMDGSVTFGSGDLSIDVFVAFSDDDQAEFDEDFTFTITGGEGTSGDTIASADGSIENDDATLSVSFEDGKNLIREGSGTNTQMVEFVVERNFNTDGAASATWTLSGEAVDAGLFANISGDVSFANGQDSQTVRVAVTPNADFVGDLAFTVTLSAASGAQILVGQGDSENATIVEDDSTLAIQGEAEVLELDSGSNSVTFMLERTGSTAFESVVGWRVVKTSNDSNNAANADFVGGVLPSGTLTLGVGQSEIDLSVPNILGDMTFEGAETFRLELFNATSGDAGLSIDANFASAVGTILDNEARVNIQDAVLDYGNAEDHEVQEGVTVTFTVLRTGHLDMLSTVNWNIAFESQDQNGTGDFAGSGLQSGTVIFLPNEPEKIISVFIRNDSVSELDEVFRVNLLTASPGTSIGASSSSFFTVVNDDADRITLSPAVQTLAEGDGNANTTYTFTLTRENSKIATTVDWAVEGSGLRSLDMGRFEEAQGQATFALGNLTTTVEVKVLRDDLGDFDREFTLTVSNPVTNDVMGAELVNESVRAVVLNDDPAISIGMARASFVEGSGTNGRVIEFNVVRTGDTTGTASVAWTISSNGDSGTNIADFGGYWPTGVTAFNNGESLKTIQVALAPDAVFEPTEGFKVKLSNLVSSVSGAKFVTDTATGTVTNDDTGVFVQASVGEVREGQDVDFTISAQGLPNRDVKVYWVVEGFGLSPANVDDFAFTHPDFDDEKPAYFSELRLDSNGEAEAIISIATTSDNVAGIDERFRLRVVEVVGGTIAQGRAEVTIQNDDSLVGISPASVDKSEGDAATTYTFTVTRTGDPSQAAAVNYTVEGFGDNPANENDFVSPWTGMVQFEANQSSVALTLTVSGDSDFESDESFVVRLTPSDVDSSTQIEPSAAMAVGVIRNDDSASLIFKPLVAVVKEGTDSKNFLSYEIIRNGDNSEALEVDYVITGASVGDFDADTGLSGTLVLEAGQSRAVLMLGIEPNLIAQVSRNFDVAITAPGFTAPTAVSSTIVDDDSGISVVLLSSATTDEDDVLEFVFEVTRNGINGVNLAATNVAWILNGLGDNGADDSDLEDGQVIEGSLLFGLNDVLSKQVVVKVRADNVAELTEGLRLTLLSSTDNTQQILVSTADAYILDDDAVTSGDDVIQTGMGADRIEADDGDDLVYAGGGADRVYGGNGNDTLHAQGGADVVFGESGDDTVVLNSDNLAHFAESTDANSEGHAVTYVNGGTGDDTLVFEGVSLDIDLDHILEVGGVRNFETIVLGDDDQTLALSIQSLVQMQTMRDSDDPMALHVTLEEGVANAKVIFDAAGWTQSVSLPGAAYVVWTHAELSATLHIDTKFYAD